MTSDILQEFTRIETLDQVDPSKMDQWRKMGLEIGRADVAEEIKRAYRMSGGPILEEIRVAYTERNHQALKKHFHKMKGGCGNVGFIRLQKMCDYGENLIASGQVLSQESMGHICRAIENEFKNTMVVLEKL